MDKKGTGQKGHKCLFLIPQRGAVRNSHRSFASNYIKKMGIVLTDSDWNLEIFLRNISMWFAELKNI